MTQLLFTLDSPSKAIQPILGYLPYAFIVLDTSKELEEGTRVIYYPTKLDWNINRGTYSFMDEEMDENIYEYTCQILNK